MPEKPVCFGVYLLQFPFLESPTEKLRPVVVVSEPVGKHSILLVVPVSSVLDKERCDTELCDWSTAGLLKPSIARVHRLTAILQVDLEVCLGQLSPEDSAVLQQALHSHLRL